MYRCYKKTYKCTSKNLSLTWTLKANSIAVIYSICSCFTRSAGGWITAYIYIFAYTRSCMHLWIEIPQIYTGCILFFLIFLTHEGAHVHWYAFFFFSCAWKCFSLSLWPSLSVNFLHNASGTCTDWRFCATMFFPEALHGATKPILRRLNSARVDNGLSVCLSVYRLYRTE